MYVLCSRSTCRKLKPFRLASTCRSVAASSFTHWKIDKACGTDKPIWEPRDQDECERAEIKETWRSIPWRPGTMRLRSLIKCRASRAWLSWFLLIFSDTKSPCICAYIISNRSGWAEIDSIIKSAADGTKSSSSKWRSNRSSAISWWPCRKVCKVASASCRDTLIVNGHYCL